MWYSQNMHTILYVFMLVFVLKSSSTQCKWKEILCNYLFGSRKSFKIFVFRIYMYENQRFLALIFIWQKFYLLNCVYIYICRVWSGFGQNLSLQVHLWLVIYSNSSWGSCTCFPTLVMVKKQIAWTYWLYSLQYHQDYGIFFSFGCDWCYFFQGPLWRDPKSTDRILSKARGKVKGMSN